MNLGTGTLKGGLAAVLAGTLKGGMGVPRAASSAVPIKAQSRGVLGARAVLQRLSGKHSLSSVLMSCSSLLCSSLSSVLLSVLLSPLCSDELFFLTDTTCCTPTTQHL